MYKIFLIITILMVNMIFVFGQNLNELNEKFSQYDVVTIDTYDVLAKANSNQPINFKGGKVDFNFTLKPNELRKDKKKFTYYYIRW